MTETQKKSVRRWALDTGMGVRTAQRLARAYQEEVGGLTETVNGFQITREQWEKITRK